MSIKLEKNQKIQLKKGLNKIIIGSGWSCGFFKNIFKPMDVDLSLSAFTNKKILYTVSYMNLSAKGIIHSGDNLTGSSGKKIDEAITVEFSKLNKDIIKLRVFANIYRCYARNQHFGQIKKGFVNILNSLNNNEELCSINFTSELYKNDTTIHIAEIENQNGVWNVKALKDGTNETSIEQIINNFK